MHAIELINVSRQYGRRPAVRELNLQVQQGELFGFLGPNGAGKTTTIRLIMGFLRANRGAVRVLDQPILPANSASRPVLGRVGFLPDIARLDGSFGGAEWLDYLAALHPVPLDRAYRRRLCTTLELGEADLHRRIKTYSRGMRQKLAIIQALQHRPALIIMDEPTEGLDPLAKRALFGLLLQLQQEGTTVFFSSHVLSEVERLCDRVALIRAGRLVAIDSIVALRNRQTRRVELSFGESSPDPELLAGLVKASSGTIALEGERWRLTLQGDLNPLLQLLATYPVRDVVIEPADLEDIFISYYRTTS